MQNELRTADQSIAKYDAYIFASVGRTFDANKADMFALNASIDCEAAAKAARKAGEPAWLVAEYKAKAEEFAAIAA